MIGKTALHYFGVLFGSEQPHTQTSEAERAVLRKYLRGMKRVVEIGVFEGFTTRVLAESSDDDAVVYGIDPFFPGRLGISWGMLTAKKHTKQYRARGKVRFVRALSADVGDRVPTAVDYVFIDGDHSLSGITTDWAFWKGRLESKGIIALHDTLLTPDKPKGYTLGSIEYFRDHIRNDSRFEIVAQRDSLSVLRKR